ncbi:adult cuticle protein [Culex quinquefasciatus]|uniref:Adult cuticle protein n=1 Tax=Culex quinquefasciatus TaxID=7176 RepID=B0W882_CULQU|nr:adult cuticle protein [Culex quinquefasciatus]|eukprot:XP_001844916.1 adult cuticle protein [Culex quinquefasciatus]
MNHTILKRSEDNNAPVTLESLMMVLVQIGVAFGMSVTVVFLTTPKMMTSLLVFVLVLALAVAVSAQWEGGFEGGYGETW